MDIVEIRRILSEMADLQEAGRDHASAKVVRQALSCDDDAIRKFLVSNDLWGGSGSIADQSLLTDRNPKRKALEGLLIKLGRIQIQAGVVNARTESWVSAFEEWKGLPL